MAPGQESHEAHGTKFIFGSSLMDNEVSKVTYMDLRPKALGDGRYVAAPGPYVLGEGLEHVQTGFDVQKEGRIRQEGRRLCATSLRWMSRLSAFGPVRVEAGIGSPGSARTRNGASARRLRRYGHGNHPSHHAARGRAPVRFSSRQGAGGCAARASMNLGASSRSVSCDCRGKSPGQRARRDQAILPPTQLHNR